MNNMFEIHHRVKQLTGFKAAAIAGNVTVLGEIIDTAEYTAIEWFLQSKIITDGDYVASINQGDDSALSDSAPVSAEETLGSAVFAPADDDTTKRIGSIGKKRYQQLQIVSTNVTTGVDIMSAVAGLFMPRHAPVAD